MSTIARKKAADLYFDVRNPRLVEFANEVGNTQEEILNFLWRNMAIESLVLSIIAQGFFESEPLIVIQEDNKWVVIEGNRRLAAIKAILHPDQITTGAMDKYQGDITKELIENLRNKIPVVIFSSREESWREIGFKHVNGAVKWDSYAKAKYIAQVHNDYNVPLKQIAKQIGDTNRKVLRLYQSIMILQQAQEQTTFSLDNIYANRIFFSHLYTAMGYKGYQKYVSLDPQNVSEYPIPQDSLKELEEVMLWLFGKKGVTPIIRSQNPDLRKLEEVLQKREAVLSLRKHSNLDIAYELCKDPRDLFAGAILEGKQQVEIALSKLSHYDGNDSDLSLTLELGKATRRLYDSMREQQIKAQKSFSDDDPFR